MNYLKGPLTVSSVKYMLSSMLEGECYEINGYCPKREKPKAFCKQVQLLSLRNSPSLLLPFTDGSYYNSLKLVSYLLMFC